MTLPVSILTGGLATGLGDLARETPKSLIDVAGKPFVVHQLELLRRNGVTEVVLCQTQPRLRRGFSLVFDQRT